MSLSSAQKRHLCRFFLLEAFQSCDILAENIEFYIFTTVPTSMLQKLVFSRCKG